MVATSKMEKAPLDLLSMSQAFFSLKSLKLKSKQQELLIRVSILLLVYILAFITRLFSVLRYESMIHEFDPYFNYRTTLFLTENGFYEFWNWFDSESWYPLGRIIGGTLFPGLMVTAAFIYWTLRFLRFAVHIREVCVLTAPFFASNTTLIAYFFGKELWDSGAGLVAAALIAICPGYISRSVAGSYDNEGVAIFALLLTFYLFVKAVNTGSLAWALASAFGCFYMVSAWGGYVFIINLIPLYVLVLLISGRYSMRLPMSAFFPLIMVFIALVNAETSDLFPLRKEFRRPFPLYDYCPNCVVKQEYVRVQSATYSEKKDIDIIVTYIDPSGTARTRSKKFKHLSSSWVWKYPHLEKHDLALSSQVISSTPQGIKRRNESEHQWGAHKYESGTSRPKSSPAHPLKLQRRISRLERRERRAAELINQSKEIDDQMQEAAIAQASEVDTTTRDKYGIWRKEYDNPNADSTLKLMRDQVILARAYATIAKAENETALYDSLLKHSRESQRAIGEATSDAELQPSALDRAKQMGHILSKAKVQLYHCMTMERKLRAMLQSTEDGVSALKKKSAFLVQLAAKTVPKPLHCFSLLLATDYFLHDYAEKEFPNKEKLEDRSLYHYAIFSDNVLATSVVVNSTVLHAKEPEKHVFHIVTDKLNFAAMKMWFLLNPPPSAAIEVENVDDFTWLNSSYCPVLRQLESARMIEYYFRAHQASSLAAGSDNLKYRNPKYLSMLNHLRFYLPEVYPKLDKILFLDDDIVVQKDLTPLWSVDLQGLVNGAVETCKESFHRFDKYLNFSNPKIAGNFDADACGWAFGMNIFDLKEWRNRNITGIYHYWQVMNEDRTLWKLGTLPPGLITFYNFTYPLERNWHVLGLGYDPALNQTEIESAGVVHYNGNYKPWLDLAIVKYRSYWSSYVMSSNPYLRLCDIKY